MIGIRVLVKLTMLVALSVGALALPADTVHADCGAVCVVTDDGNTACLLNQPNTTLCIPTDLYCYQFPELCI